MKISNQAWVLTEKEKFRLTDIEEAPLREGWVRLTPAYCGVCGSDLHSYKGLHPMVHPPIILGHEFSATVKAVSSSVDSHYMGKPVVCIPSVPCGECYPCRHGQEHICTNLHVVGNIGLDGALATFLDVPSSRILPIPTDMDLSQAALVEPAAVAIHALSRIPTPDQGMIVMGAGPIGLLTALLVKAQGISPVTILDILDDRLSIAQELGVDFALNSRASDLADTIESLYPKRARSDI